MFPPIYVAAAVLFALAKFGVAGLLYSVAPRLRGLSLLGTGFMALGIKAFATMAYSHVALDSAISGASGGIVELFGALQIGIELVAWAAMLGGALMVAEALRTRAVAPTR